MMLLGKKYLRVTTPQTTDGQNLTYADDGTRVLTKETHLPTTARKHLEAENANLPIHLRHKIEEVENEDPGQDGGGNPDRPKSRPGRPAKPKGDE